MIKTDDFEVQFVHHVPVLVKTQKHCSGKAAYFDEREATLCIVTYSRSDAGHENTTLHHGFGIVNPTDGYDRAEGRKASLTHALLNSSRWLRTCVWGAYWCNRKECGKARC